jgi:hypothetical protein
MTENWIARRIRQIDTYFIHNVRSPNLDPYLTKSIVKVSDDLKKLYVKVLHENDKVRRCKK